MDPTKLAELNELTNELATLVDAGPAEARGSIPVVPRPEMLRAILVLIAAGCYGVAADVCDKLTGRPLPKDILRCVIRIRGKL